jgi:hypothetical protein
MTIDQLIAELQRLKEEGIGGTTLVGFDANSTSMLKRIGIVNYVTLTEDTLLIVLHET